VVLQIAKVSVPKVFPLVFLALPQVLNLEDSISKVMVPMEFQLVSTVTAVEQDQVMVQEEYQ